MTRPLSKRWLVGAFLIVPAILLASAKLQAETSRYDDSKSTASSKEIPVEKSCETPKPLEIRIGIPGWTSQLQGDFGVKGVISPLDITFSEILSSLDAFPIALSAELRYNRWEFFADGEYVQLHDSVRLPGLLFTNADIGVKFAFWEGFVGYRVINCEKGSLSLFAGARYNYYSGDLQIFDNGDPRFPILRDLLGIPTNLRVSGSIDWVDPVVGLSGRVKICKPVSFWAKADVGGFGVNSGLTWQAQGGLEFQVTRWLFSQIGWRYMKYDFTSGGFTNKTDLNGPFFQSGINF
ncbi:MAG TPA: hypothetical protein VK581_02625 [Chthoniobacterales bacterium]|nr:hypothetical protein [Chthoniobacterales bacterium]